MKQCYGYVRVSSHKQGEGVSLDAQKDAILRFADQNGISITKWFEEEQTAAKSGRPVFNSMLKSLQTGKVSGVVMHKIDRSARNFFDWAKIGELADNGIEVHFATESLDFQSRGGRLTANIQMAVAEDYVRNLKAEIHKGQRGQLERGFYPFSAPIGYQNNGKKQLKTIDPVVGPLVRQAFELYASGQYSFESLRREMVHRGFRQANGRPRSRGCFEAFLGNPFYAGIIRIKRTGEIYEGAHEPLISVETFEQAEAVRAGRRHKRLTRHQHLFRGLFACGQCGRSMIPERQKGHLYYRCHFPDCAGNSVRQEPLDQAVQGVLSKIHFRQSVLDTIEARVATWIKETAGEATNQSVQMLLSNVAERLTKLEDAAIDGIVDRAGFLQRKEKLLLEQSKLEQRQRQNQASRQNPQLIRGFLERVKNLANHYKNAKPGEKREIVEIATSNRTVLRKYVSVEPSKWLQATQRTLDNLACADARATSRTFRDLKQLADIARSDEADILIWGTD